MVLSNKKQKQKLRAAKAELLTAYPEKSLDLDLKDSHSLSILTGQESQKPNVSKREKRRQKAQLETSNVVKSKKISADAEKKKGDEQKSEIENKEDEIKSDVLEVKKKKKRKRDDSNATENVKEKAETVKKKKKKAKKKKKPKNVDNGLVKEGGEQDGSEPSGEHLVAMPDESRKRGDDVEEVPDKVYVGGIPYYSTEDDIRSYFEHCGTITEIDCMTFPDTGKFRGIAIITFKTEAAAKRALALDGSDMGGLFLKIQPFKSAKVNKSSIFNPTILEGYNRIYIGNLSWDITEDDLKKLFSDCTISSIRFGKDKETGEFKGYAHVDFADSDSLNVALKLDQTVVYGRPVKISCAVPKKGTVGKFKFKPTDNQLDSVKVSAVSEDPKFTRKEKPLDTVQVSEEPKSVRNNNQLEGVKVGEEWIYMREHSQLEGVKVNAVGEDQANRITANYASTSKIKRRTCYECGEKGHLFSACPNKQEADVIIHVRKDNQLDSVKVSEEPKSMRKDNQFEGVKVNAVSEEQANNSAVNPISSSTLRRRTCYECGEKGHLSSACPKKQAVDVTNNGAV